SATPRCPRTSSRRAGFLRTARPDPLQPARHAHSVAAGAVVVPKLADGAVPHALVETDGGGVLPVDLEAHLPDSGGPHPALELAEEPAAEARAPFPLGNVDRDDVAARSRDVADREGREAPVGGLGRERDRTFLGQERPDLAPRVGDSLLEA